MDLWKEKGRVKDGKIEKLTVTDFFFFFYIFGANEKITWLSV